MVTKLKLFNSLAGAKARIMAKYFGTDGIRGKVGEGVFTPLNLLKFGHALGQRLGAGTKVVIGRDTRQSGDMIEAAITTGLMAQGVNILRLGVLPTPAIALLTARENGDMGIMLTASHNPHQDNGIKLFGPTGTKLSATAQTDIEARFDGFTDGQTTPQSYGIVSELAIAEHAYIDHLISSLPRSLRLKNTKIVLDLAHGAASKIGPKLFHELGAEVITIGDTPNGTNINAGCGSTATDLMAQTVIAQKASLGLALDGDADRLICVDEYGQIIDGDQLLAILARHALATGTLKTQSIVATIMSNLGFELWAKQAGLTLERTKVGDKHVAERMAQTGANLGGENSGHIIMTDHATTGDGLLAALHILAAYTTQPQPMSVFAKVFEPSPQKLVNIRFDGANPLANPDISAAIDALKANHSETANIVIRKSGTENLIRIMAQAKDIDTVDSIVTQAQDIISGTA